MYKYLCGGSSPSPFLICSVLFMLAAIVHVTLALRDAFVRQPAGVSGVLLRGTPCWRMWISLGIVKVIHEFGHGLSCKAFKGECHDMGVLSMCLSPALYCNVTDAWTLADRSGSASSFRSPAFMSLFRIAAVATFVWWYTPAARNFANVGLAVMVLCSVSTVMFNANPLMRFDGYYILADWMEIPNLREKSECATSTTSSWTNASGLKCRRRTTWLRMRKFLFTSNT